MLAGVGGRVDDSGSRLYMRDSLWGWLRGSARQEESGFSPAAISSSSRGHVMTRPPPPSAASAAGGGATAVAAAPALPAAAGLGLARHREQTECAEAALSFSTAKGVTVLVRKGCIGDAAMSGRFALGGVVSAANPQMCGNDSDWWGFKGLANVDGLLRGLAPGLAAECRKLAPVAPNGVRLLPGQARATVACELRASCVIHALGPTVYQQRWLSKSDRRGAQHARERRVGPSAELLRASYTACLRVANERGLKCLAIPALSCGVGGIPARESAEAAYDAVEDMEATNDSSPLSLIEFVLRDSSAYYAFADSARSRWGCK